MTVPGLLTSKPAAYPKMVWARTTRPPGPRSTKASAGATAANTVPAGTRPVAADAPGGAARTGFQPISAGSAPTGVAVADVEADTGVVVAVVVPVAVVVVVVAGVVVVVAAVGVVAPVAVVDDDVGDDEDDVAVAPVPPVRARTARSGKAASSTNTSKPPWPMICRRSSWDSRAGSRSAGGATVNGSCSPGIDGARLSTTTT